MIFSVRIAFWFRPHLVNHMKIRQPVIKRFTETPWLWLSPQTIRSPLGCSLVVRERVEGNRTIIAARASLLEFPGEIQLARPRGKCFEKQNCSFESSSSKPIIHVWFRRSSMQYSVNAEKQKTISVTISFLNFDNPLLLVYDCFRVANAILLVSQHNIKVSLLIIVLWIVVQRIATDGCW